MDHFKVLKRAWDITWRYRVLWVFGLLLALATSRGGGSGGAQYNVSGDEFASFSGDFPISSAPPPPEVIASIVGALIAIGLALACVFLILIVVFTVIRYVSETALIRLVDDHEETGEKRSLGRGIQMGWSRSALRQMRQGSVSVTLKQEEHRVICCFTDNMASTRRLVCSSGARSK